MNERIMDYAEQARLYATSVHPDNHDIKLWEKVYHEKFAELIYKDIITVVAAQALSNHSALDVFKNLRRIYEEIEE